MTASMKYSREQWPYRHKNTIIDIKRTHIIVFDRSEQSRVETIYVISLIVLKQVQTKWGSFFISVMSQCHIVPKFK